MSEFDDTLDKEIEEGIARAERMLRRQRITQIVSGLILVLLVVSVSFWGYSTHQQQLAFERATATEIARTSSTAAAVATATQKAESTATQAANQTATVRAQKYADQTATVQSARAALTERAAPTVTARAKAAAEAAQIFTIIQRIARPYVGDISDATLSLSPTDGELRHNDDDYIEIYCSGKPLRNFVMFAEFENPYAGSESDWDIGFLFRDTGVGEFRLAVSSYDYWSLTLRDSELWETPGDGEFQNILNKAGRQKNTIYLIVSGEQAYFFLNQTYIDTIDVSQKVVRGEICVATGLFSGHEVDGKITKFNDFTIWALP